MLFLPIFFVFSGLRTDVGSLGADPRLWIALAAVVAVSCASKFGATALAARATGLPWKESLSIGLLMNTRALMALVVINIGADMGVVSPAAFFWLVTMALFTTVITTPILRRAYPTPEAALSLGGPSGAARGVAHPRAELGAGNRKRRPAGRTVATPERWSAPEPRQAVNIRKQVPMQSAGFRRLDFQIDLEIFGKTSGTVVPRYSADRAAAEQVVRKVRQLYPDWKFTLTEDQWGYTATWQCPGRPRPRRSSRSGSTGRRR